MWVKWAKWLCFAAVIAMQVNVGAAQAQQPERTTYKNPINLGNMGDPFVFRWNGRYYLYPTVGGQGLRTWISEDLINWQPYAGYVAQEPVAKGAYAPEVLYWNGTFYMYISRDKDGHYVLKSDSPTGPFLQQTGTLGLNIDGSVFIDNDGQWYFTHAAGRGIRGHKMLDPYRIGAEVRLNSDLGGWTEGPGILQHNGYYFMTYTGNHFLSKGYRIDYSVSDKGPLGPYEVPEDHTVILSTKDDFSGLGHNSNVIGPDLDSYYAAYHNRQVNWGSATRLLNIDRMVFNGKKMAVLGATNWQQQAPKMADFYTWIDEDGLGDRWAHATSGDLNLLISQQETDSNYTAEFNFSVKSSTSKPGALIGVIVSLQDPGNFVYANVDVAKKTLSVVGVRNGERHPLGSAQLPGEFDFTKLHSIRVDKNGTRATFYFDMMRKLDIQIGEVAGGSIGYVSKDVNPIYRYTAFSNDAEGSSDYDVYKPIPGNIEAVHYLKTNGYHVEMPSSDNPLRPNDGTSISKADETYAIRMTSPGDWLVYNINVEKAGLYGVDLVTKVPVTGAKAEVLIDGKDTKTLTISAVSQNGTANWYKVRAGFVDLPSGFHKLTIKLVDGQLEFRTMSFYQVDLDAFGIVEPLTQGVTRTWAYYGTPTWNSSEQGYSLASPGNSMVIMGNNGWTDYTVEADVKLAASINNGEAGLLLRASNASYYETQVVDAMMGYYVALNGSELSLKRLSYGSQTLETVTVPVIVGQYGHLKVEAVASNIKVFWQDMTQPVINYRDANAFTSGAVGLRSNRMDAFLKNLTVQCASCSVYGQVQVGSQALWIQPHVKEYNITLPFSAVDAPQVDAIPLPQGGIVSALEPQAHLIVTPLVSIPGSAEVKVVRPDDTLVHSVVINVNKETSPIVSVQIGHNESPTIISASRLSGRVQFETSVNGPEALFRKGSVVLKGSVAGENVGPVDLYTGKSLPKELTLDTLQLADGVYELVASVDSIYETAAQASLEFTVKNWDDLVDELLPPSDNTFFGTLSQDKTVARSTGWEYAAGASEDFFGDTDRLTPKGRPTQYLIWDAPGLQQCSVTVYSRVQSVEDQLELATSTDMQTWTTLPYTVQMQGTSSTGWSQLKIISDVPTQPEAKYLRLSVTPKGTEDARIQIGQVQLHMLAGQ